MHRVHRFLLMLVTLLTVSGSCGAETRLPMTAYWNTPVPSQSPSPPAPEACGACHPDKYADWIGSRHAHAFSPGLLGQIIDFDETDAAACLDCHAPLADQQTKLLQSDLEALAKEFETQRPRLLAQHGVFCAACHLRDGVLHAPSISTTDTITRAHPDTKIEPLMRDSRFCSSCHQFGAETAVNGKPLQNTYREWLDSPYAGQGITCQSCHMPGGAHLFRGIHDADMVRQALDITTRTTAESVELVVRSTGVGHRFPTYSVARVHLTGTVFDSNGQPIPEGYRELALQRRMTVDGGQWFEISDTRLQPGESVSLRVPRQVKDACAARTLFQVIVEPEWYYHDQVYPSVIAELEDGPARDLLVQARSTSESLRYVLFEDVLPIDCAR